MPRGQPVSGNTNAWNDTAEKRLLLLIIAGMTVTKDWDAVATKMGSSYSASACKQKFQKLKRAIESELPGEAASDGSTSRKRAQPAQKSSDKTGKLTPDNSDDEDDDAANESYYKRSAKKVKTAKDEIIVKNDPDVYDLERDDLYDGVF